MTSPSLPPVLAATAPASAKLEIGGRPSSISPEPSEREPLRSPGSDAAASADSGSSPRQGLRPGNAKESRADQAQTQQPHVNDGEGEENSWSLFIYDVFCIFWSLVVSIFFRAINARNVHSIPRTGPVIFVVAPHHNQFIDPLILLKHSPRRVYYLVAAKSMRQKFIGFYGRCLRGIPVERAADLAKLGTGSVRVPDPSQQPTRVVGIGTRFTSELKPNERIAIGNASSRVVSVISDTELEVQAPGFSNAGEKIVEALSSKAGASFKCIPHLSYDQTYKAVYDRLNHGECVGIFPEGGSHDRTQMLPLKAGVALMALGAMSANPDLNIKIVPTGLNYFHPSKFRSRAVIEFGYPIEVPREMVELYKRGGDGKRRACNELLETISEALKNVTINTPDYETLQLIQAGRRLYRPGNLHLSMNQQVELTRRFVK
ncbi:Glycerol-3-phosphate/dihydroxyacetone phosphate acyltransferase, partial [Spiromyces aspiralis]